MARNVQSQSGRPETGKTFLGLLVNAVFWLVLATVLPLQAIVGAFPELAPYASWAPTLFYLLAFWSFIRALRTLQRLTAGRARSLFEPRATPRATDGTQKQKPQSAKQSARQSTKFEKTQSGLPVTRTPTVQRMR